MTDIDRFTLRHVTENRQEMKKNKQEKNASYSLKA